jgi:putative ABC transport system permease protein
MIRHTIKLIWNRKRRNILLMSEVFLAFVVMFIVATTVITGTARYLTPLGFSYEDRWLLHLNRGSFDSDYPESETRATMMLIRQELEAYPEIEGVSFLSSNSPYSRSVWMTGLERNGEKYGAFVWLTDDNAADVLNLEMLEGRWFGPEDNASPYTVIVLNRQMKDEFFGEESPVGKIHVEENEDKPNDEYIIVGVVENYRYRGEFDTHRGGYFERNDIADTAGELVTHALLSVREGSDARVEERILKHLATVAPGWNLRIETLTDKRESYLRENFLSMGIGVSIAGFLIFNVALGLFGVLWQSINRRHGEIGLRRAVGANQGSIARQILSESLMLATFAIAAGILVAIQVPILRLDMVFTGLETPISGAVYVLAMACAAAMIYLLVSLCALYPSQLAARVQPAAALHDD